MAFEPTTSPLLVDVAGADSTAWVPSVTDAIVRPSAMPMPLPVPMLVTEPTSPLGPAPATNETVGLAGHAVLPDVLIVMFFDPAVVLTQGTVLLVTPSVTVRVTPDDCSTTDELSPATLAMVSPEGMPLPEMGAPTSPAVKLLPAEPTVVEPDVVVPSAMLVLLAALRVATMPPRRTPSRKSIVGLIELLPWKPHSPLS